MAVDPEVSGKHIREELQLVRDVASSERWGIIPDYQRLIVLVTMYSCSGDLFVLQILCDDYKQLPPFFEFIDPDTGESGTLHAYPRGHDSFFHASGPCICAPFNRKAYKMIVGTGPHQDWQIGDWQTSTANNTDWSNFSKIGDMLGLIYARLSRPNLYAGRMG